MCHIFCGVVLRLVTFLNSPTYLRILYDVISFACIKGEVSMARGNLVSGLPKHHQSDVNLYLFPNMENKKDSQGLS